MAAPLCAGIFHLASAGRTGNRLYPIHFCTGAIGGGKPITPKILLAIRRILLGTLVFGATGMLSMLSFTAKIPSPFTNLSILVPGFLFGLGVWMVSRPDWKGRIGHLMGWIAVSTVLYVVALITTTWLGFDLRELPGYFFSPMMALLTGLIACRMAFGDRRTPIAPWILVGITAFLIACIPIYAGVWHLQFGQGLRLIFPFWQVGVGFLFVWRRERVLRERKGIWWRGDGIFGE